MHRLENKLYQEDLETVAKSPSIDWVSLKGATIAISGATGMIGTFLVDLLMHKTAKDEAGIRVICNYRDDVYSVSNYLSSQSDIQVLRVKDYIKNPKQNGYRSLHVIYAVPVFLSSGAHYTPVEVQFRTIAMDYWASLEHALRYKTDLPDNKLSEHSQTLLDCARSLQNIEVQMQNIHRDINGAPQVGEAPKTSD